jgi:hypothetical protein
MKKLKQDQNGFIPMMIALLSVIVILIVLAYLHVQKAKH